jgi:hypothetical protein
MTRTTVTLDPDGRLRFCIPTLAAPSRFAWKGIYRFAMKGHIKEGRHLLESGRRGHRRATVDEVEIIRYAAGVESNTAAVVGQSVAFD